MKSKLEVILSCMEIKLLVGTESFLETSVKQLNYQKTGTAVDIVYCIIDKMKYFFLIFFILSS